jgi:hypothetical protein
MKTRSVAWTGFFALLSTTAFGQLQPRLTDAELSATGPAKLLFAAMVAGCGVADSLAKADLARQQPFLLLAGGIAPVAYMPTDSVVEQKYRFRYYEYGCSLPEEACVLAYNQQIFAYLTATYGKRWLKAVRPDVVGLQAWRRIRH